MAVPIAHTEESSMSQCRCTAAEAAGITKDPWHTQPHPQPATLVTVETEPFVGETPFEAIQSWITPSSLYYARNHFPIPSIDVSRWTLAVDGQVAKRKELGLSELLDLPRKTMVATMECAGNNRVDLDPPVGGNQFGGGAVSTALWAGVSLSDVLERADVGANAVEVLFEGADSGEPVPGRPVVHYLRSLPMDAALGPDTILAHEMNGERLSEDHGHPLRLVVPRWFGMASVKWLRRITVLDRPFDGYFQTEKYVLKSAGLPPTPLTRMFVKSLISSPRHGEVFPLKEHKVMGLAWSGTGAVDRVELSDDFGETWRPA
jgi:DMSO/TMAO reductase YedYZ molybdopterin-dependent catalytic subunit